MKPVPDIGRFHARQTSGCLVQGRKTRAQPEDFRFRTFGERIGDTVELFWGLK